MFGRSLARAVSAQSLSLASFAGSGLSRAAKERTRAARLFISGQAAVSPASSGRWPSLRASCRVSRSRVTRLGDRCGRLDAALGDVAVEQVHAAGVAEFADLGEHALDGHGRVLGAAAQAHW
jgi:hypothetical protein